MFKTEIKERQLKLPFGFTTSAVIRTNRSYAFKTGKTDYSPTILLNNPS